MRRRDVRSSRGWWSTSSSWWSSSSRCGGSSSGGSSAGLGNNLGSALLQSLFGFSSPFSASTSPYGVGVNPYEQTSNPQVAQALMQSFAPQLPTGLNAGQSANQLQITPGVDTTINPTNQYTAALTSLFQDMLTPGGG